MVAVAAVWYDVWRGGVTRTAAILCCGSLAGWLAHSLYGCVEEEGVSETEVQAWREGGRD